MFTSSCLYATTFCLSSPDSPFSLYIHSFMVYSPPRRSSFPSSPLHIHPRQSLFCPHILHPFPWHVISTLPYCLYYLGHFSHFRCPLTISLLILSIYAAPHIHFNVLISATSNFFSCVFFAAPMWYFIETNQEATVDSARNSRMTRDSISSRKLNVYVLLYSERLWRQEVLICFGVVYAAMKYGAETLAVKQAQATREEVGCCRKEDVEMDGWPSRTELWMTQKDNECGINIRGINIQAITGK